MRITVIQRDPLKVVFQISVTDARPASFTPDGQFVVFGTEGLRFEKWSIADAKPVEVRELVVRRDCWEHEFSPDGKYLACVDRGLGFKYSGNSDWKESLGEKNFYRLSFMEYFFGLPRKLKTTNPPAGRTSCSISSFLLTHAI